MKKHYDVIVVGSGVSGLYAALQLEKKLSVLILSKEELILNNTSLAQGGIAAVLNTQQDSANDHFRDTMIAGGFYNNPAAVRVMVEEGPNDIHTLIEYGVAFDRVDQNIHFTLEGGHSFARILHYQDSTGYEIADKLIKEARRRENIDIVEHATVFAIQKKALFHLQLLHAGQQKTVTTRFCVLATGGIGRAYEYTTNSKAASGDGIMLAYKLGAVIKDLHMIQFHPTGLANEFTRETFLISEAVRGEGAYLLNRDGERFLARYDDRMELAPRDVVSRAMIEEQKRIKSGVFYLDITHQNPDEVRARFPRIDRNLRELGIDMTKQKIPVYPCQHYAMGGIETDLDAHTTITGLYAVGECANTGVHGRNRLASNSLLEALVFSRRAAAHINNRWKEECLHNAVPLQAEVRGFTQGDRQITPGIRTEIRKIMQKACFVIPQKNEIVTGLERVRAIKRQLEQQAYQINEDFVEAYSLSVVAYLILQELI